jgi:hypothetical protein
MIDSRIVTTAYRYRRTVVFGVAIAVASGSPVGRPPKKRKAIAIAGPAVVRKAKVVRLPSGGKAKPEPAAPPPPANDDRKLPPPGARKPAIVTTTSRKRTKLLRAEQATEPQPDDAEADAAMRAWLERAKWGHGPA